MSIIPTIDQNRAVKIAKNYLAQLKDWKLIALRCPLVKDATTKQQDEYAMALYEIKERNNILDKLKAKDATSELILRNHIIRHDNVSSILEKLSQQGVTITERTFRRKQRQALLFVYELIPSETTTIAK